MIENIFKKKKVLKPWGYESIWAIGGVEGGYIGKLIHINPGHRLSFQYHVEKEETVLVKSGTLYIETAGIVTPNESESLIKNRDREIYKLSEGDVFHIPRLMTHRFFSKEGEVEIIEVSSKEIFDIVRIEDDYGRA